MKGGCDGRAGSSLSRSSTPQINLQDMHPNKSIVVLGAGRGLDALLRALRGADIRLTVIVSIAYDGEEDRDPQERLTGAGVDELRRSLEALSGEGPLLRAIRRPLKVEQLGRHRLGNLALASAAAAFGDYSRASIWLGEQLGIDGAVLPATIEPTRPKIKVVDQVAMFKPSRGRNPRVREAAVRRRAGAVSRRGDRGDRGGGLGAAGSRRALPKRVANRRSPGCVCRPQEHLCPCGVDRESGSLTRSKRRTYPPSNTSWCFECMASASTLSSMTSS